MNQNKIDTYYNENFTQPIIKIGRFTNLLAVFASLIPALTIWAVYGAFPGVSNIVEGWFLIFSIYGVFAIVEPLSFFPVLGIAGTYMSFLSGNISNMRVPASSIAQEAMQVEPGTKKAELVSVQAIAGSVVTGLVVTTIAALGGAALMNIFPPIVISAFSYVTPALFGGLFTMYMMKKPSAGLFAFGLAVIVLFLFNFPSWFNILFLVFATIAFSFSINKNI